MDTVNRTGGENARAQRLPPEARVVGVFLDPVVFAADALPDEVKVATSPGAQGLDLQPRSGIVRIGPRQELSDIGELIAITVLLSPVTGFESGEMKTT